MKKAIYVEQALHGYANGHQLLASSCVLELADRKKMDELSDLSGRNTGEEFVDYYTGYPIEGGKRYVVSKTWYAYEMARPGCVWTHSLIFCTEDVCQLTDFPELMNSFQRPIGSNFEAYIHPLYLYVKKEKDFPAYDVQRLQYEIFTICSSETPKYILVDAASDRFENELFMVLCSLPPEILRTFTFCTMSYDVRKYEDRLFQYQILPRIGKNSLAKFHPQALACEEFHFIKSYPYWIQCYMRALLQDRLKPLHDFIRQYGANCVSLEYFSQFSRLYFALIGETAISLTEYIHSIDMLFPSDQPIQQKTVEMVLDDRFFPKVFVNQEYQVLEIMEMKCLPLETVWKKKLEHKIIQNTPEKLYPYLKRYIAGKLSSRTCEFVENMIPVFPPDILQAVSHMDRNICFVLVRRNPDLLLCVDIWRQPKDFQQEIICAISQNLESELLKKLLSIILQVDAENITEDFYRIFGNRMLPVLYDAIHLTSLPNGERLRYWTSILLRNQELLIEEILSLPNAEWRRELFSKLDMNIDGLAQRVCKETWLELYHEFFAMPLLDSSKGDIAIQFLPAVFCTNYYFEDEFIRDVVGTVYQEVKNNIMNSDTWSRFQQILPQVEDYQAWDRCLRIRKALEQKGYQVSLVEY